MDALCCTGLHPADVGPRLESSRSYEGADLGSPRGLQVSDEG
jgi:hypothetical protein